MAERKAYLLRLDPELLASLQQWAADDLRSLNGQIEFLLRRALRDAGRLRGTGSPRGQDRASRTSQSVPGAREVGAGGSAAGGPGTGLRPRP